MSNKQPVVTNLNPYSDDSQPNQVAVHSEGNAMISVETQKTLAEVQASVMMALQFPRNQKQCVDKMLVECQRSTFAEQAVFSYSRGGTAISGLTIRSLEMIARQWRNIKFGFRVLDRRAGKSLIQAYAYDFESNVPVERTFEVKHWRDTKKGGYQLTDERDIYELEANQAQRRVRSCIEALIPADVKDMVREAVEITLRANADISPAGRKKLIEAFGEFKVNQKMIEAYIQRNMDSIEPANVVALKKIYISLRDGMSSVDNWFDISLQDENEKSGEKVSKDKKPEASIESIKEENKQAEKPETTSEKKSDTEQKQEKLV